MDITVRKWTVEQLKGSSVVPKRAALGGLEPLHGMSLCCAQLIHCPVGLTLPSTCREVCT